MHDATLLTLLTMAGYTCYGRACISEPLSFMVRDVRPCCRSAWLGLGLGLG